MDEESLCGNATANSHLFYYLFIDGYILYVIISLSSYCVIIWVRVVLKRTVVGYYPHPDDHRRSHNTITDDHKIQTTDTPGFKPFTILYLLVSMRAMIAQFSGYSPPKFKVDSVAKLFCDLSPTVLNFHSE